MNPKYSATTSLWPSTVSTTGTFPGANVVYNGTGTTWTTSTTPYATEHLTVTGDVVCKDIQIANASLATMLQHVAFLMPPAGLNLENPTVLDMYGAWLTALDAVRQAHHALAAVVALTQTND